MSKENKNTRMQQLAASYGLTLGEEFRIQDPLNFYVGDRLFFSAKLLPDSFKLTNFPGTEKEKYLTSILEDQLLASMVTGRAKIAHKPWKPQEGDKYEFIKSYNADEDEYVIGEDVFSYDNVTCLMRFATMNCFRSYEEAKYHAESVYKALVSKVKTAMSV